MYTHIKRRPDLFPKIYTIHVNMYVRMLMDICINKQISDRYVYIIPNLHFFYLLYFLIFLFGILNIIC